MEQVGAGLRDQGQLFAFHDAVTGKQRWTADAGGDSYSSPQVAKLAGRDVVLLLANTGLAAVDAKTGKSAWNYDWASQGHRVVQPMVVGDSSVLLGTGMDKGTRRIEVVGDKNPDKHGVQFEDRWTSMAMKPDFNDYVAFDGFLYGLDHNILSCVDLATGEKKWKNGRYGNGQILLLPDSGAIAGFVRDGRAGADLAPNPAKLDEVARQKVLEGKTWRSSGAGRQSCLRSQCQKKLPASELPLAGQSTAEPPKTSKEL